MCLAHKNVFKGVFMALKDVFIGGGSMWICLGGIKCLLGHFRANK